MKHLLALAAALAVSAPAIAQDKDLSAAIAADYDNKLEALFLDFHRNPELSYKETRTAAIMADEWRNSGFQVTENVGGTGVVAVMENGAGPTLMLRADMDGLPVKEDSGLPYASTATQVSIDGQEKPVMHACGHDVHVTSLIGAARQLVKMKDQWKGTLVLIAQPAEERIGGATDDDGRWSLHSLPQTRFRGSVSCQLGNAQQANSILRRRHQLFLRGYSRHHCPRCWRAWCIASSRKRSDRHGFANRQWRCRRSSPAISRRSNPQ